MKRIPKLLRTSLLVLGALLAVATPGWAQGSSFEAVYLSATGWVRPGETFPTTLNYEVALGVDGATVSLTLSD